MQIQGPTGQAAKRLGTSVERACDALCLWAYSQRLQLKHLREKESPLRDHKAA